MSAAGVLDRRVAREAARWLMHLASGQASADDAAACERWRASDTRHEQAWQHAQRVNDLLGGLPPQLLHATLGRPAHKTRRLALKAMAGMALGTPAAWAAWRGGRETGLLADYRSAPGERRDIVLPGGTFVSLNSGSALDLSDDGAVLRAGEVYVRAGLRCVAHAPQGQVTASHARYALRLDAEGCRIEVYEGQVQVRPALGVAATLAAPQAACFDAYTVRLRSAALESEPAWLRGVLHVNAMPLAAFAAELGRYRRGLVRCAQAVAALPVSGTFQLDNTEGILRALPALLPVSVRSRTPYWIVIDKT
ncbi:DUF4880 domain-containing protein [Bordetella avium]|uniref:Heme uptake transmembrane sensor n=3 Tax=Bordetella avium TaxID=521 RepID=Q2KUB5_BORA1|nr:DUF4880 domain-containing protein [Bordetella avium]AAM28267.1 RhuR [Bordetella avium]RIQ19831.1 DUF4880 domain-containing protein [Bordetella avium]RIQ34410.1 DUF4880 domain-containing protein [Bordetella avium]RIQ55591.1 DUF4880 domain-containing protein [Bordetella avium]RIQ73924.1 DUF4880 domain-containing protein [Bordetella avium]